MLNSIIMGNEKGKTEETVEKGIKGAEKGLKKGWDKMKDAGKKVEKAIEGDGSDAKVAEQKKCPQCGVMNPKGATKCASCGRPLT